LEDGMKKLLSAIPLVGVLCLVTGCQDKAALTELAQMKAQASLEKENEAIARRLFAAIDAQDFVGFKALLAPGMIVHYSGPQEDLNVDAVIPLIRTFYRAFPNYSHSIEDIFAKGDRVVLRMLQQATHKADFEGLAPTGRDFKYYQITILQIKDAKVQGWWIVEDNLGMMTQLGMELKPKGTPKK
jgi:C-1 hydroxylase